MRFSQLFTKTQKTAPKDEESVNAKLLMRAGFINKEMAGAYTFLPLGLRVLSNIESIVREEMNAAGGQEVLMPALHPKEPWQKTGRWDSFGALFKLESRYGPEYALGPTHEEILYPLLTRFVHSYRDLPQSVYQIQTKFRDEPRAKSGLLRGKEFRMKDLYSFHADAKDRDRYYETMRKAYNKIFRRIGLDAVETQASGGTFSDLSLEFQVLCEAGEDKVLICEACKFGINEEIAENAKCPRCKGPTNAKKAVEVGNIFPLKDTYSKDFHLTYRDKKGGERLVAAGCYGIGTSRVLGTMAEISNDEQGLIWPAPIAPFFVHLIALPKAERSAQKIYEGLREARVAVLYDDRPEATAGEKFADADLMGIPWRVVVSEKTLKNNSAEVKRRTEEKGKLVRLNELSQFIKSK